MCARRISFVQKSLNWGDAQRWMWKSLPLRLSTFPKRIPQLLWPNTQIIGIYSFLAWDAFYLNFCLGLCATGSTYLTHINRCFKFKKVCWMVNYVFSFRECSGHISEDDEYKNFPYLMIWCIICYYPHILTVKSITLPQDYTIFIITSNIILLFSQRKASSWSLVDWAVHKHIWVHHALELPVLTNRNRFRFSSELGLGVSQKSIWIFLGDLNQTTEWS